MDSTVPVMRDRLQQLVKFSADHRSVGQYMDVDILLLNNFSAFGAGHHHTVMQVRRATNPTKRARGNRAFAQEKSGGNPRRYRIHQRLSIW